MLDEIEADARQTARYTDRPEFSPRVMRAMALVPRHRFVPEAGRAAAYANRPQPIGSGQTISQPYMVALMTDLLDLTPESRVLEIGTGSGYQTAVLARLAAHVHSVEVVTKLADRARTLLIDDLGLNNVSLCIGDGAQGWPEAAPFDGIMVTAAPDYFPRALGDQLKPGGCLVVPVGRKWETQWLVVARKQPDGGLIRHNMLPVSFVPLV
ncbi:protein-L-isoaspartate(D-aspartate) O-methyltransferase [Magnetospira sp. QH-2]|uniref:protein-L-isoaspartate(D-aspartate) O-methyltransferase n=1 Tax=Magnetospira sp. (strain QH-2) TaxID=1288970 RepID=UPI0003E80D18|nr:protein-L-isoaspartate(D-aspartate) O-methyltransferase [Magnetospira sp. QH-2]CCQ75531.1 Protein-L-isoaspartate(D-aspartate) O-methyltransferase [Magnetospira sp. QH-2]